MTNLAFYPYNGLCLMKPIRIRPGYIPYTLAAAVLLTGGSAFAKVGYERTAIICLMALAPLIVAALLDRIEFDGERIIHRGPLAFLLAKLFRLRRELTLSEVETVTTEATTFNVTAGGPPLNYSTRNHRPRRGNTVGPPRPRHLAVVQQLFRPARA